MSVRFPDLVAGLVATWVLLATPGPARACGGYYPLSIIADRALVDLRFYRELADRTVEVPAPDGPPVGVGNRLLTFEYERTEPDEVQELVRAARAASDPATAFAVSEGLPTASRHYFAGAVAYHDGDHEEARRRFVAALAEPERTVRSGWAAWMLGLLAADAGDLDAARRHFDELARLVAEGVPDPLGLAVARFGHLAWLHEVRGEYVDAIHDYAIEAVNGGRTGKLRYALDETLADSARLEEALADDVVRVLLLLHLERSYRPPEDLEPFVESVEAAGACPVLGADLLAAKLYERGLHELARRVAACSSSLLGDVVRAKLALRAGNIDEALSRYHDVVNQIPEIDQREDEARWKAFARLGAERATLLLYQGELVEALDAFVRNTSARRDFWADAAHVAERVLTIDELMAYVDARVPPVPQDRIDDALLSGELVPEAEVRALLARRLVREGRISEALRYFDDEYLREAATEFAEAMARARRQGPFRSDVTRARLLHDAATIARFDGLDILGYELDPDYRIHDGDAQFGGGTPAAEEPFTSAEEVARFEANAPDLEQVERFHYRWMASDLAVEAAELLPPRSQAYAAVLCEAAGWVIYRDPGRAEEIYLQYLQNGPYVPWGREFGTDCPPPDFDGAADLAWRQWRDATFGSERRFWAAVVSGVAMLVSLLGLGLRSLVRGRRG